MGHALGIWLKQLHLGKMNCILTPAEEPQWLELSSSLRAFWNVLLTVSLVKCIHFGVECS